MHPPAATRPTRTPEPATPDPDLPVAREPGDEQPATVDRWIWRDVASIAMGMWLLSSPWTIGYHDGWLIANDTGIGALIVVVSTLTALSPRLYRLRWLLCALGLWLLYAPLWLWARDPGAYATDTLIGALVILFSVVIPGLPCRADPRSTPSDDPGIPRGWSYNPSSPFERVAIVAAALLLFFLSRYLAAFQLGHIGPPWEPFFGEGARRVLDSDLSKDWPISDAGLAAAGYLVVALAGCAGDRNRWRTAPWLVLIFVLLVCGLELVNLWLVIQQPTVVGDWCTLCLATAAIGLLTIAPAADEAIATIQLLAEARADRRPILRTLWNGGTRNAGVRTGPRSRPDRRSGGSPLAGALDVNNVPWNLPIVALVGLWLLMTPAVIGASGAAAATAYLFGVLVTASAVVGFGEATRPVRLLNVPVGLWLAVMSWELDGATRASQWSVALAGIMIAALSLRAGTIDRRLGGWNRWLV
jgi:vitamin K epoxide reductase family protein